MKNIVFYVFVLLLSATLVYIIIENKPKRISKIIFVETTYSYLAQENLEMDVSFYVNMKNNPLVSKDSYDYLYLSNHADSKRLEVTIKEMTSSHYESYLGEDYLKYTMTLFMPYLFGDFEIEDLFISVYLMNLEQHIFKLGSLFIKDVSSSSNHLNWTGLNGIKEEHIYLSRLGEIHMDYLHLGMPIESISMGTDDQVTFSILEDVLVIDIVYQPTLLYDVPLIITFIDDTVQTIQNFPYIIDYQIIKESGPLLHVYALN
jgi:hypothetical protein